MEELHKIQNKARLLYEMLDNLKQGDVIDETSTMGELKAACESALGKVSNMLKEEEDKEKLELLAEVKSSIKGVVLKYEDVKHGHYDTTYDVSGKYRSELNNTTDTGPQAISLIDLDDVVEPPSATTKHPMDELSDIFSEKTYVSHNASPSNDPFDLLSQSITANTLPPSSPNIISRVSGASSPLVISSPAYEGKLEKTGTIVY